MPSRVSGFSSLRLATAKHCDTLYSDKVPKVPVSLLSVQVFKVDGMKHKLCRQKVDLLNVQSGGKYSNH